MADERESGTEQETQERPEGSHPIAETVAECHRCGAAIPAGQGRCPECGRRLYRVCYCGWRIPVTTPRCPQCDADWSGSSRVRKRTHSHKVQPARLGAYAVAGALAALVIATMSGVIMNALASRALSGGESLPPGIIDRLGLAWNGGVQLLGAIAHRVAGVGAALSIVLVVVVVGAGIGVVLYLTREDLLRLPPPPWKGRKERHRRRRAR